MKDRWRKIIPGILIMIVIVTTGADVYYPFPSENWRVRISRSFCWLVPTWCANWPLEPRNQYHHVLTTAGEFLEMNGSPGNPPIITFHTGLDIYDQFPAGAAGGTPPFVLTKDAGVVTELQQASCYEKCMVETLTPSGQRQSYSHWDSGTLSQEIRDAHANGTSLAAGTRVAQLVRWPACEYHHLHFEVCSDSDKSCQDPLPGLYPREGTNELQIGNIYFKTNDAASTPIAFHGAAPTVSGQVDIVVEAADLQAELRRNGMRVKGPTGIQAIGYEILDAAGTTVLKPMSIIDFSHVRNPAYFDEDVEPSRAVVLFQDSTDDYCNGKRFNYVITNVRCEDPNGCRTVLNDAMNNKFDLSHSWNTRAYSNGTYTVKVTIWDHASNSISANRSVSVAN